MFKIIKTSTYNALVHKNDMLLNEVKFLQTIRSLQGTNLEDAHTEHIKLIRENGELQRKLHTLTAKKLPIKKSKSK